MDKLDFFEVKKDYVQFLQDAEIKERGFTRVPNIEYSNRKNKFICGIVLTAPNNDLNYFVGITSYSVQKSENILIKVEKDNTVVKGSLRFNYMFPVPNEAISPKIINDEPNAAYKNLLLKDFQFVNDNIDLIKKKALEVYTKIITKECSQNLLYNSCDFVLLEKKCLEYIKIQEGINEKDMQQAKNVALLVEKESAATSQNESIIKGSDAVQDISVEKEIASSIQKLSPDIK